MKAQDWLPQRNAYRTSQHMVVAAQDPGCCSIGAFGYIDSSCFCSLDRRAKYIKSRTGSLHDAIDVVKVNICV